MSGFVGFVLRLRLLLSGVLLLRLLKSDVHVSVETGQNPCAQNAISILIRKDGGE